MLTMLHQCQSKCPAKALIRIVVFTPPHHNVFPEEELQSLEVDYCHHHFRKFQLTNHDYDWEIVHSNLKELTNA